MNTREQSIAAIEHLPTSDERIVASAVVLVADYRRSDVREEFERVTSDDQSVVDEFLLDLGAAILVTEAESFLEDHNAA